MNRRDVEGDPAQTAIGEIQQPLLQPRFIQIRPAWLGGTLANAHARMHAQVVELAQAILQQKIMDEEATRAAESLALLLKGGLRAWLAAVKTTLTCGHRQCHGLVQHLSHAIRHPAGGG